MSNTIDWGKASVNNTIDYGQGAIDNTINWGKSQTLSPSGETNITGTPSTPSFSNVNSFSFDGVDDYFLGTSTYSELDGQSKATISAWIKVETNSDSLSYLCSIEGGSAFTIGIRLQTTTSTQCWVYVNGAGNNSRAFSNIGIIKNDGLWHHLVVCLDLSLPNTQECQIYLDNVAKSMSGYFAGSTLPNANSGLFIGNRNSTYSGQFGGKVDELAIWSGTDLRNDVATIYNNGEPTDLNNNGLTAPTTWSRLGDLATWNGATWTMTDVNGGYTNRSINMVEANRTTDVPTASTFSNTKSIALDGVDDTINVGATPLNLRFNRLDTFSFSAWVKVDTTQNNVIISNQLAPSTNYRGYYFAVNSSNQIIIILRSTLSDRLIYTSTTTITNGVWNHIVFTYDGTATTTGGNIYIDNSLDTLTRTGTLTGTMESTDALYMGCRSNTDNFFDGILDEVSIFNTELSASDVTSIYNGGVPNDISSLSPLSWWRCGDGDTAPTLTDNGSGGNDGTMTNFTTFSTDVPT